MRRLLQIAISFFSLVLVGFVILGILKRDGVVHQSQVVIESDIEEVWRVFTDTNTMPQWMFGLIEVQVKSGSYVVAGSRVDFVYKSETLGQPIIISEEITAVNPPHLFSFTGSTENYEISGEVTLLEVDGGVEIRQSTKTKGKSFIKRAVAPLFISVFQTSTDAMYGGLKRVVEKDKMGG